MDDPSAPAVDPSLVDASAMPSPGSDRLSVRRSVSERIDEVAALERQIRSLQARQAEVLAWLAPELVERDEPIAAGAAIELWQCDPRYLVMDVAAALRLSETTTHARLLQSAELVRRLPRVYELFSEGEISPWHAWAAADAIVRLTDAQAVAVEQRVISRAPRQNLAEFKRALRKAVHAVDALSAEARHAQAAADRDVRMRPGHDGMADIWALMPAPDALALMQSLNAEARSLREGGDSRTLAQLRADLLATWVANRGAGAGVFDADEAQSAPGPRVHVTVGLSTLLDLDDAPGELEGIGAITAEMARQIAADPTSTWSRLVVDDLSGTLLDYGRTRYRPPPTLVNHVVARDRRCMFPGVRHEAPVDRVGVRDHHRCPVAAGRS